MFELGSGLRNFKWFSLFLLKAIYLNYELEKKGQDRLFLGKITPQTVSHTFMQKSHRCYIHSGFNLASIGCLNEGGYAIHSLNLYPMSTASGFPNTKARGGGWGEHRK